MEYGKDWRIQNTIETLNTGTIGETKLNGSQNRLLGLIRIENNNYKKKLRS